MLSPPLRLPLLSSKHSVVARCTVLNHRPGYPFTTQQRSCLRALFLCLPLIVLLTAHLPRKGRLSNLDNAELDQTVRNCEFADLAGSFQNPLVERNLNRDSCWKLEYEYLQVPTEAILNRNHLPRIGAGDAGMVFGALIQLSNDDVCYAALKSDYCQESLSPPWENIPDQHGVACIQDGSYMLHAHSFLLGEITGMVVQYSYYRRGLEPPAGLLPNWAVVKAPASKKRLWWPSWRWNPFHTDYQAPDPSLAVIIMPITKFTTLDDYMNRTNVVLTDQPAEIASLMLPAAQSLEVIHGLGLLHQDMHSKNVVVNELTGKSMLVDLGLMAQLHECLGPMCDYCTATVGHRRFAHDLVKGLNPVESEVYHFSELVADAFFTERLQGYRAELLACTEAWQVVRLLERWVQEKK